LIFDDYILKGTDEVQKAIDLILFSIGEVQFGRCRRKSSFELLFKNKQLGIRKLNI